MKYRIKKTQEYNGRESFYPQKKSVWWPFWVSLSSDMMYGAEYHYSEGDAVESIKMDTNYKNRPTPTFKNID